MDLCDPMPTSLNGESSSEYNGSKNSLDISISANPSEECVYNLKSDGENSLEVLGIVEVLLLYAHTSDIKVHYYENNWSCAFDELYLALNEFSSIHHGPTWDEDLPSPIKLFNLPICLDEFATRPFEVVGCSSNLSMTKGGLKWTDV